MDKSILAGREDAILDFWQKNNIFEKTLQKESPKGNFIFYDGPPFATGLPHFGHILPTTMKDVIPRYKTMQGFNVPRRWGWDCHGLPIENLIEKELGLKNKKDIEDYGIDKFNQAARGSVLRYADQWKEIIPRLGRWVDMDNDYRTMNWQYSESVWWSFKKLFDNGRVYESFKSMHICPRCGTTLSNFEVNQGYKDITDISAYVKFELIDEPNTFVLAWTTTPWTLPGNVALAVNPEIEYVKAEKDGAKYVLAKNMVEKVLKENFQVVEGFSGSDLVDKSYKPVFGYYQNQTLKNAEGKDLTEKTGWKIYGADFVTLEDGTGVVHIAPAFGEDDLRLGQKENLPFVQHVDFEGKFKKEVVDFAGESVKPKDDSQKADIEIIKYLAHNNTLFAKEKFIHSYPHCWRCDTPLLNYATSSWFVRVTDFKDDLVKENKNVNWVPETVGDNRFGKWLEGARDWAISRSRYWGAPLPVWRCSECKKLEVIGSLADLKNKTRRNKYIVMRHGEALHNLDDIISDSPDDTENHLTDNGVASVTASADKLKEEKIKIDLIFSSDILRVKETAQIVADSQGIKEVFHDSRLQEYHVGDTPIKTWKEFTEAHPFYDRFEEKVPGGETWSDVVKRMTDCLYDIDSKYEGKTILIASHQSPILMLELANMGLSIENVKKMGKEERLSYYFSTAEWRHFDFAPLPHNEKFELDFHRPYIDNVSWKCSCGGSMKRVPEVFDTWYDSGSVPFASVHYPFEKENQGEIPKLYPADYIAEGLDQTRGWFYSLIVLGVELFKKSPYKNVVVNGLVLAEDGRKMSKSLKNYPDLMEVVNKFSADALRYFFMSSPVVRGEEVAFSSKGVDEVQKKILMRLDNVVTFYEMYKDQQSNISGKYVNSENVLDQWIIARLNQLTKEMTEALERYELDRASRPIADFVDDLSTWYLRRSRDRFKGDNEDDRQLALQTTQFVLREFSKLIAPFIPFTAEEIYQKVKGDNSKESVHLEDWPILVEFDGALIKQMQETRQIVSLGLEARMKSGIKVRQPLARLTIGVNLAESFQELIRDEVNVKEIAFQEGQGDSLDLDTEITPELKEEGNMREIMRAIQELRKESGLNVSDRVGLKIETSAEGKNLIEKFKTEISKVAGLSEILFEENDGKDILVENLQFKLKLKNVSSHLSD